MNKRNSSLGLGPLFFLLWAISATAAPNLINYQGLLNDNGGNPVNSDVAIEFALYDSAIDGALVWGESHPVVAVNNGVYHVMLGSGTPSGAPLSADIFSNPDLWLQITVNTKPLSPRQKLASVPYSMRASISESVPAGSITGSSIAPGSITANELAAGSITPDKLSTATCAEGEALVQSAIGW